MTIGYQARMQFNAAKLMTNYGTELNNLYNSYTTTGKFNVNSIKKSGSTEALNKLLDKLGVNPSNTEFDVVYVNGDHAVANMTLDGNDDGKVLKVRQIENEFMDRMFEDA